MASPSVSPPTISPPSPASPSPPSVSPPPEVSLPPASQPNADPPTSSSPPLPVLGSTPPAFPPPAFPPPAATTPIPSLPPPTSPPPAASPPPIISPPPVASPPPIVSPPPPPEEPPLAPPPPLASPPAHLTAPPLSSPPLPLSPSPSPPTVIPSPSVGSPPPPITPPTPTPTKPSAPTPTASPPLASPAPPSINPPPSSSPPHASPSPSPPTVYPSPTAHLPPPPAASPPLSVPTPSNPAPPTPANDSPSPPPLVGSPPSPDSQPPSVPSLSPPSRNDSQSVPLVSPPGKSPSIPPSSPRSPPSNPTRSAPPVTPPTRNSSFPVVPITPVPPGDPNVPRSPNSAPDSALPGEINSSGAGGIKTGTAVGVAVIISFVVLGLAGTVLWSVMKRKKKARGYAGGLVIPSPFNSSHMSESSDPRSPTPLVKNSSVSQGLQYSPSDPGLGHSKAWFTYEELSEVTNGFSNQNILGEGGFGCVYKGCLPDGREVAVKQLKVDGGQGEREFMAEVEIISRVHHRHLVSLVGYCISEKQRLLIYDYVPNNTLHYHLHGEGRPVMDWTTRLKVALGAARGLAYLHEDCHPRIIHRDIKSSNILLDNNFEAQVSDFGLAKLAMDACTHVTTRVVGTFGYMAPEYASSGKLTSKSDVFSFGVVILELVTGRKPVDPSQPLGDESLVEWARPLMTRALETGEFEDLPDPRLDKNYNRSEMFRMIEVAAACVRHSAAMRPHMGQVARALDCLGDSIDLHNGVKPGQSELFNSAQHSAEIRLFQRMAFGSQDYSTDFSETTATSWSRHK